MTVDGYELNNFGFHCRDLARTLTEKAEAYGDSYKASGDFLKLLYPSGIPVDALPDVLTMARVFEKLKRIANNPGKPDPGGESPWHDIAGLAVLAEIRSKKGAP